jgi:hypothetical protein
LYFHQILFFDQVELGSADHGRNLPGQRRLLPQRDQPLGLCSSAHSTAREKRWQCKFNFNTVRTMTVQTMIVQTMTVNTMTVHPPTLQLERKDGSVSFFDDCSNHDCSNHDCSNYIYSNYNCSSHDCSNHDCSNHDCSNHEYPYHYCSNHDCISNDRSYHECSNHDCWHCDFQPEKKMISFICNCSNHDCSNLDKSNHDCSFGNVSFYVTVQTMTVELETV